MKVLGNIIWLLVTGLYAAIIWCIVGVIWCITIVGIPFGKQCFKFAKLVIWPFGRKPQLNFKKHPVGNVFWIIFGGEIMILLFGVLGAVWCCTLVGIPFGLQCFKLAKLSCAPFGAEIVSTDKDKEAEEDAKENALDKLEDAKDE